MAIKKLSFAQDREQIFHRHALAEALMGSLIDPAYKSGLFLSAPRRTGKTTFFRADLLPLLREAGAVVIYADLWEQRSINPAQVIVAAIRDAILLEAGIVQKAAMAVGLKKVTVGGLEMDLDAIGAHDGDSLAKTLQKLGIASDKPIVMVVDEAQHAQTTEEGRDTMFALKAARDAMILGEGKGFRLIATGSNSDRLRLLVASKDQAFFGAKEEHLPELADDYLAWVLKNSPFEGHLSLSMLRQGFDMVSRRPEHLQSILQAMNADPKVGPSNINEAILPRVAESLEGSRQMFMSALRAMDPLDAAVFRRMSEMGNEFTPFDEAALTDYQMRMSRATGEQADRPTKSSVQSALERLRKESLVWNAGRGLWYVEDSQYASWARGEDSEAESGASRPKRRPKP
jgi:hypothetical protein